MPSLLSSKITRMTSVKRAFHRKPEEPVPEPIAPHIKIHHDPYFFNDKRCQQRALFMMARLRHALSGIISRPISAPSSVDSFWRMVAHRLYTLNYLLYLLPNASFLDTLPQDGRGGLEAHFAVRYALKKRRHRRKTLLEDAFEAEKRNGGNVAGAVLPLDEHEERARQVIEECLLWESVKTTSQEKDEMYMDEIKHLESFPVQIELEEDRDLRHTLKRLVQEQTHTQNPFEDDDLVVKDEVSKRQADSGFYDDWYAVTV